MLTAVAHLLQSQKRHHRLILAAALVEIRKRYAGSLLGPVWLVLYPLLFLGVYLFVWLVVFQVRFPGYSEFDYVVFVFAGLVPFLLLAEAVNASVVVIRQNMHLVKSVIMPVEILPTRAVAVAVVGQLVALAVVLVLSALNGTLSWPALLLPLVIVMQVLFMLGLAWLLAPMGVMLPDSAQMVQLVITMLMFLSPIAFKADMVPATLKVVLVLNPVTYLVEAYRAVLIAGYPFVGWQVAGFVVMSVATFVIGAAFCARFKDFVVDFE